MRACVYLPASVLVPAAAARGRDLSHHGICLMRPHLSSVCVCVCVRAAHLCMVHRHATHAEGTVCVCVCVRACSFS